MTAPAAPGPPRSRPRRLAAVGALLVVGLVPLLGPAPAGATTAPLVTDDGLGVRVDEDVIIGPRLWAVRDALQPFVDAELYDRAVEIAPPTTISSIHVQSDVGLSVDFRDPATSGLTDGGMDAQAYLEKLEIHYVIDSWWAPRCDIWVLPESAVARASAPVDQGLLPDSPLAFGVEAGDWDAEPDVVTTGLCWPYLVNGFDDLFQGGDIVDTIEGEVTDSVQDAVDALWTDTVATVLGGVTGGFAITFDQVRADDHGLVVTADVDATGGVTIPGLGGPWSVANAVDAGVTSDVDELLANRVDGAIVSFHPNVANQLLYALTRAASGQLTGPLPVSVAIEDLLLDPKVHENYADGGWTVALSQVGSTSAPSAHPTGPDGAPEVRFDPIDLTVWNTTHTPGPVAIFRGSITDTYDPNTATVTLTRLFGNPDVVTWDADPSVMTPYARAAVADHAANLFAGYPSLGPTVLGGGLTSLTWCSTCTRYPDDERYTAALLS